MHTPTNCPVFEYWHVILSDCVLNWCCREVQGIGQIQSEAAHLRVNPIDQCSL